MARGKLLLAVAVAVAIASGAACGGGGDSSRDAAVDVSYPDAPDTAPTLTSFTPTPANVTAGVPAAITWTWTYENEPPIPQPICTIDNGVGEVQRGQMTMVTLMQTTTFRLTCTNRAGTSARDTVISIPLAAPTLATFTATPSPLMPNTPTAVTFSWTYSGTPSPAPTCTIDAGIGAATNGMQTTLTLGQARTYRLRCTSSQGTSFRDASVAVNECAGGTADCGANSTCSDTPESFTCACNSGYAGNGDVCSATNQACTTPGICSANATCSAGTTCVCNPGYVGDGLSCTRERIQFLTSVSGTGNLSSWAGVSTTGLAAADQVCAARATAAGLTGTYVAWMSDMTSDAYCRVHGLTGKKSGNCGGMLATPTAGPWVRLDAARSPAAPTIDKWLAPTRQTFYPVNYTEGGSLVTSVPLLIWTGTDENGVYTGNDCSDWTSADTSGTIRGVMGDISGGGTSWTDQGTDPTCGSSGRLRCVEVATGTGPSLPPRHPTGKHAFLTSVSGNGMLSTWADAQSLTGVSAADAICQARARYAGYTNAASFKAWVSYSFTSVTSRVFYNGPWYRPDGILIGTSKTDLTDYTIGAPLYQTELGTYATGNAETGSVWTGTYAYGSYNSGGYCNSWLANTSYSAVVGRFDVADYRWLAFGTTNTSPTLQACSATDYRLYCVDDTP